MLHINDRMARTATLKSKGQRPIGYTGPPFSATDARGVNRPGPHGASGAHQDFNHGPIAQPFHSDRFYRDRTTHGWDTSVRTVPPLEITPSGNPIRKMDRKRRTFAAIALNLVLACGVRAQHRGSFSVGLRTSLGNGPRG